MLEASVRKILDRLGPEALVLDVGGAARPFPRADWILDLRPYEARGQLGWDGDRQQERFGPQTWVQRDICDREPWPFADGQFDFAICSHTLEDVRDPVWACQELQRVARAGYIEIPALEEEVTYGIQGPWVGWGHHHWLVLVGARKLEFVFKHHVINRRGSHRPNGAVASLSAAERAQTFWWEGSFDVSERFLLTPDELDGFLAQLAGEDASPGSASVARLVRRLRPTRR